MSVGPPTDLFYIQGTHLKNKTQHHFGYVFFTVNNYIYTHYIYIQFGIKHNIYKRFPSSSVLNFSF